LQLKFLPEKLSDSDILTDSDDLAGQPDRPMLLPIQPVQMTPLALSSVDHFSVIPK